MLFLLVANAGLFYARLALSMGEARRWSTSQLCLSDDLRLGMHSRMQVQRRMVRGGAGNSNDGPMWLASIGDENALRIATILKSLPVPRRRDSDLPR
ncbi:hypothetical protein F4801DRAFT_144242 [Xylaria longipes]|nr:hypothetical protein F4801DRAFT_144242 [Xylaria longipes]